MTSGHAERTADADIVVALHSRRRRRGLLAQRRLTARWNEIAKIAIGEQEATIRRHAGKNRRLNLKDLENAPHVRAALEDAQRRLATHRFEGSRPDLRAP